MVTEDYILRMIRDMGRMLSHLLGRESEGPANPEATGVAIGAEPPLLQQLTELADRGEIDRAEDMLFEALELSGSAQLPTALDFFDYLNDFSDTRLIACGYSREEIFEGLRDAALECGVDRALLDAFRL